MGDRAFAADISRRRAGPPDISGRRDGPPGISRRRDGGGPGRSYSSLSSDDWS